MVVVTDMRTLNMYPTTITSNIQSSIAIVDKEIGILLTDSSTASVVPVATN